jgi:hypothetical protein
MDARPDFQQDTRHSCKSERQRARRQAHPRRSSRPFAAGQQEDRCDATGEEEDAKNLSHRSRIAQARMPSTMVSVNQLTVPRPAAL